MIHMKHTIKIDAAEFELTRSFGKTWYLQPQAGYGIRLSHNGVGWQAWFRGGLGIEPICTSKTLADCAAKALTAWRSRAFPRGPKGGWQGLVDPRDWRPAIDEETSRCAVDG